MTTMNAAAADAISQDHGKLTMSDGFELGRYRASTPGATATVVMWAQQSPGAGRARAGAARWVSGAGRGGGGGAG
ncbi:MAG: hypothetical protein AAGG11_24490, partial [Pseudomonadota bacterium]